MLFIHEKRMPCWLHAITALTPVTEAVVCHKVLLPCEGITKSTLAPSPPPHPTPGLLLVQISIQIYYKSPLLTEFLPPRRLKSPSRGEAAAFPVGRR